MYARASLREDLIIK